MSTGRTPSSSGIYHVMCRGVGRQIIFEDDEDRRDLLERLAREKARHGVSIISWCLMDNHIHLLVHAEGDDLPNFMRAVLSGYARGFNDRHDRVGHLFQDRYKSEAVETEQYLMTVIRYIHQNPEVAGIARTEDYRWSSYAEYLGNPTICDTSLVSDLFEGEEGFVSFHRSLGQEKCLEEGRRSSESALERALAVAIDEFGESGVTNLKSRPREDRNRGIKRLLDRGLSTRQIERLTGVSRGVIGRVLHGSK